MKEEKLLRLNNLLVNVKCLSCYRCVQSIADAPSVSQVYAEADLLDCIECDSDYCEHLVQFSNIQICKCPLRKMIAINYHKITD